MTRYIVLYENLTADNMMMNLCSARLEDPVTETPRLWNRREAAARTAAADADADLMHACRQAAKDVLGHGGQAKHAFSFIFFSSFGFVLIAINLLCIAITAKHSVRRQQEGREKRKREKERKK
uniref:Uncharacterized protein n=1 Tax=Oryza brachyantha TaxID=4533 RepID=J3N3T7_ORYBR